MYSLLYLSVGNVTSDADGRVGNVYCDLVPNLPGDPTVMFK
jgi:hypothetical protein